MFPVLQFIREPVAYVSVRHRVLTDRLVLFMKGTRFLAVDASMSPENAEYPGSEKEGVLCNFLEKEMENQH